MMRVEWIARMLVENLYWPLMSLQKFYKFVTKKSVANSVDDMGGVNSVLVTINLILAENLG